MKNKKNILLIALIGLGIGFAALSATLTLNGTVSINGNASDFQVVFDKTTKTANAHVSGSDYSESSQVTYSTTSDTSMSFNPTHSVIAVGDYYEISYKLTNNSTLYDAIATISCGTGTDGTGSLTPFSIDTTNSNVSNISVTAQSSTTGKITFKYATQATSDATVNFTCTVSTNAVSRTESAS